MNREYLYVVIAGLLSGTIVFGGQIFINLGLSLYQIAVIPALFSLLLIPLVAVKKDLRPTSEMMKAFPVFGLVGALTILSEFGALFLGVPVAVVVLLLYTQPLWTIIFSRIFLNERITKQKLVAIVIVLLGAVILTNPFTVAASGNLSGIIVALIGGISLSGWVIFGRIFGIRRYPPVTTQIGNTFFSLLFLGISHPIISSFLDSSITSFSLNLSLEIWAYLFVFALFSTIIPHLFYFEGVKKVPSSEAGVILLLEPVSGAFLAAGFLLQPLTLNILFGGGLILISNYLVIHKNQ
jgi:drug/metabolite transporter (DMT)-like permease